MPVNLLAIAMAAAVDTSSANIAHRVLLTSARYLGLGLHEAPASPPAIRYQRECSKTEFVDPPPYRCEQLQRTQTGRRLA